MSASSSRGDSPPKQGKDAAEPVPNANVDSSPSQSREASAPVSPDRASSSAVGVHGIDRGSRSPSGGNSNVSGSPSNDDKGQSEVVNKNQSDGVERESREESTTRTSPDKGREEVDEMNGNSSVSDRAADDAANARPDNTASDDNAPDDKAHNEQKAERGSSTEDENVAANDQSHDSDKVSDTAASRDEAATPDKAASDRASSSHKALSDKASSASTSSDVMDHGGTDVDDDREVFGRFGGPDGDHVAATAIQQCYHRHRTKAIGKIRRIDTQRAVVLRHYVILLQATWRRHMARNRVRGMIVSILQRVCRGFTARRAVSRIGSPGLDAFPHDRSDHRVVSTPARGSSASVRRIEGLRHQRPTSPLSPGSRSPRQTTFQQPPSSHSDHGGGGGSGGGRGDEIDAFPQSINGRPGPDSPPDRRESLVHFNATCPRNGDVDSGGVGGEGGHFGGPHSGPGLDSMMSTDINPFTRHFSMLSTSQASTARSKRTAYVPQGYRHAESEGEKQVRMSRLQHGTRSRYAAVIQKWWRALLKQRRTEKHRRVLDRLLLLNQLAVKIQRWWRVRLDRAAKYAKIVIAQENANSIAARMRLKSTITPSGIGTHTSLASLGTRGSFKSFAPKPNAAQAMASPFGSPFSGAVGVSPNSTIGPTTGRSDGHASARKKTRTKSIPGLDVNTLGGVGGALSPTDRSQESMSFTPRPFVAGETPLQDDRSPMNAGTPRQSHSRRKSKSVSVSLTGEQSARMVSPGAGRGSMSLSSPQTPQQSPAVPSARRGTTAVTFGPATTTFIRNTSRYQSEQLDSMKRISKLVDRRKAQAKSAPAPSVRHAVMAEERRVRRELVQRPLLELWSKSTAGFRKVVGEPERTIPLGEIHRVREADSRQKYTVMQSEFDEETRRRAAGDHLLSDDSVIIDHQKFYDRSPPGDDNNDGDPRGSDEDHSVYSGHSVPPPHLNVQRRGTRRGGDDHDCDTTTREADGGSSGRDGRGDDTHEEDRPDFTIQSAGASPPPEQAHGRSGGTSSHGSPTSNNRGGHPQQHRERREQMTGDPQIAGEGQSHQHQTSTPNASPIAPHRASSRASSRSQSSQGRSRVQGALGAHGAARSGNSNTNAGAQQRSSGRDLEAPKLRRRPESELTVRKREEERNPRFSSTAANGRVWNDSPFVKDPWWTEHQRPKQVPSVRAFMRREFGRKPNRSICHDDLDFDEANPKPGHLLNGGSMPLFDKSVPARMLVTASPTSALDRPPLNSPSQMMSSARVTPLSPTQVHARPSGGDDADASLHHSPPDGDEGHVDGSTATVDKTLPHTGLARQTPPATAPGRNRERSGGAGAGAANVSLPRTRGTQRPFTPYKTASVKSPRKDMSPLHKSLSPRTANARSPRRQMSPRDESSSRPQLPVLVTETPPGPTASMTPIDPERVDAFVVSGADGDAHQMHADRANGGGRGGVRGAAENSTTLAMMMSRPPQHRGPPPRQDGAIHGHTAKGGGEGCESDRDPTAPEFVRVSPRRRRRSERHDESNDGFGRLRPSRYGGRVRQLDVPIPHSRATGTTGHALQRGSTAAGGQVTGVVGDRAHFTASLLRRKSMATGSTLASSYKSSSGPGSEHTRSLKSSRPGSGARPGSGRPTVLPPVLRSAAHDVSDQDP